MDFLKNYFSYIKGLIPQHSSECSIGLDIGPTECKMAVVKSQGEKIFQLLDFAIEPVISGHIVETLRQILKRVQCPYDSVYSAVSGRGTLIRYIPMPRMSSEDLQRSFEIEMDKYFPFPRDQIYADFYILNPHEKTMQMAVMAAACRREIIEERIKLLTELGLKTYFIGINPVALANTFNIFHSEKKIRDSAVALMDMGESVSTLTIFLGEQPRFTRDIFIGGRDFTKKISQRINLSFEEAEALKNNPHERLSQVIEAYEDVVRHMVHEMKLSLDYFSTEYNQDVSVLFLTGGASLLQGLTDILQKVLEIQVSLWDPLEGLKIDAVISKKLQRQDSFKLGVALGLALYDYD
ncbi:MAG TPA: type IV pilus assembly protein PilM [Candidatus Omnitrophota bacterium]|nr:type IV pilus assembly protein PilM [Candidatus Omnitrophota bacterium]